LKKELRSRKKNKRKVLKFRKKVLTTLDWCDIEEVKDDRIVLKGRKSRTLNYVAGIRLMPHNIFLDDEMTKEVKLNTLRIALNKLPFEIFWAFVTSPVNIDDYKARLYDLRYNSESPRIQSLIADDYVKAEQFEDRNNELEFMMFVREKDEKILEKNLQALYREMNGAGLLSFYLNKRDFLNYIAYVFDNPVVNSIYFSRGIFQYANENYLIRDNELITEKIESDAWYESKPGNIDFITDEDMKRYRRSKLMPTSFSKTKDYMTIGDRFASALLIRELPDNYSEGLLCWYLNRSDIKVMMTSEKIDFDITSMLKKDINEKLDEYHRTTNPTRQHQLSLAIESAHHYLDRIVRNNDITQNVTIVFLIVADSLQELMQKKNDVIKLLQAEKFQTVSCKLLQEQTMRMVCPVLLEGTLPREIRNNYGIPLPSEGISGLYPFVYETLKDNEGFLFGSELANNGVIVFDPFAYKRPLWTSRHDHQRTNGNMVIVGKSGFGKSVALNLTIRNDIREGYNVVVIDPENRINRLIRKYGGSVINYGVSNNIINIFDLRPLSTDEDEEDENYDRQKAIEEMWDTNNAINFVIGQVNQEFTFLFNEFSDEEASVLGDLVRGAYHRVGIEMDKEGKYPSFRSMSSADMPTFSTVREILYSVKNRKNSDFKKGIYDRLEVKLNRVCGEWGIYLNGHTSLHFDQSDSRKIVAFGTKQLQNVSEQLRTALNHIMYNYAWSLCIDNDEWSSFILDEAHVNILQGEIASLTAQFVRRARKYNTCVRLATQEPRDFADDRILTHGKAIFDNSAYKLILHLDKDPAIDISRLMSINENELMQIMSYNRAEGLFVCGERRIPMRVLATDKELQEF
ncbi:MAG: hypothetical protein II153_07445, partial [Erysipelotrichaceae bacterium]|nr:hypothetical protein [Erysipelotrichaceae bacterium]